MLIIGAGVSGMNAASTLYKHGVKNITIIEATDRVGGKIRSVKFAGKIVEAGAHIVYGAEGAEVLTLTKINLRGTLLKNDHSVSFINQNGTDINKQVMAAVVKQQEQMMNYSFTVAPGKKPDNVHKAILSNHTEIRVLIYDQRGFQFLPEELLKKIMQENKDLTLSLNTVAHEISYGPDFALVNTTNGVFRTDFVISTIPLAVLQKGSVKFNPPLPNWKMEAIHKYKVKSRAQIYVKFGSNVTQFWSDDLFVMYVSSENKTLTTILNLARNDTLGADSNMLLFILYGHDAIRVNTQTKTEVKREITKRIRNMYGAHQPEPDDIFFHNWDKDPYAMGISSLLEEGDFKSMLVTAINVNLPLNRLFFGGEANSQNNGFIDGAYNNGCDVATDIVDCIEHGDNCIILE